MKIKYLLVALILTSCTKELIITSPWKEVSLPYGYTLSLPPELIYEANGENGPVYDTWNVNKDPSENDYSVNLNHTSSFSCGTNLHGIPYPETFNKTDNSFWGEAVKRFETNSKLTISSSVYPEMTVEAEQLVQKKRAELAPKMAELLKDTPIGRTRAFPTDEASSPLGFIVQKSDLSTTEGRSILIVVKRLPGDGVKWDIISRYVN